MADEDTHRPEPEDTGCADDSQAVHNADAGSNDDAEPEFEEIDLRESGAA